jgi:NAD(P)-dependent dehydrogenase (short-subunit alcohol dehydrogenase family)
MGRLEGKVAVITGGANGIGRACCERFAEEGADILVADLLDAAGQDVVSAVQGLGRRAAFVHADAASPDDNEAIAQRAVDELGGIDVLVTAAGISHSEYVSGDVKASLDLITEAATSDPAHLLADMPLDRWHRVLDVNLTGTLLAVQAAARVMLSQARGGSIVTIASIAAKVPEAGPIAYAVSKAGVWMLTKHAARTLGPAGIRVNAIGPGFIETNMTKILHEIPGVDEQLRTQLPLGRIGLPQEVANAALFLASDESSYFTGEILHPDGGFYTD